MYSIHLYYLFTHLNIYNGTTVGCPSRDLTLSLKNNSYIFMPLKAAHYIWSYFHGMSSALYWNMGEIAHIPIKG